MKISIITVTLNSEKTIRDTLNSVLFQTVKNIEHIIVDGGSVDKTISIIKNYPNKNKKIFIKKSLGIYASINFGIKKSSGEYICILNSDDIFHSKDTIKKILKEINKSKKNIYLGDVSFFDKFNYYKITRYYPAKNFKSWHLFFGLMPPHPASIIKKEIYNEFGYYKEDYKIAADFELFLRLLVKFKLTYKIFNLDVVKMRSGGISGKNFKSYLISTLEIFKSFKINKIYSNFLFIILRIPVKIKQFLIKKKFTNKELQIFKTIYDRKFYYDNSFKIIKNLNQLKNQKEFILSGMNLAFLGYYCNDELKPHQNLFHWPDGVWIKRLVNINKIPGRDLLKKLKLPNNIKSITVLGNISDNSKNYLKKKFKRKIHHKNLPFGSIEKIKKTKINLKKNTLTFITLPTPKQEKLAFEIIKNNKNSKIICIGASIGIASGDEKEVPTFLKDYEFVWRLRSDFFRRLKRLFETLFYYTKENILDKKINEIRFLKID